MGFYIEVPEPRQKALQLKRDYDAQVIMQPIALHDVPPGKTVICVVENGTFDAAGIVTDMDELMAFSRPDGRQRTWMLIDRAKVIELAPYVERFLRY